MLLSRDGRIRRVYRWPRRENRFGGDMRSGSISAFKECLHVIVPFPTMKDCDFSLSLSLFVCVRDI